MNRIIKVTKECSVPVSQIRFYVAYTLNSIKREVRALKAQKRIHDLTNGKKILSVIYLMDGEVLLTSTSTATLDKRYNEAEQAAAGEKI